MSQLGPTASTQLTHETIETVVVGAGVIGLSVARTLARAGREVVVIEAEPGVGRHASSRNSEVIHAGIYYPTGSWKARLCLRGRQLLYDYCQEHDLPHRAVGKLIVATDATEIRTLETLLERGRQNGVSDLCWLEEEAVRELEPAVSARAALLSPSTGILDSHALISRLRSEAEQAGAVIALATTVEEGRRSERQTVVRCGSHEGPLTLACDQLVNAAGLGSRELAARLPGNVVKAPVTPHLAKGHYFALSGASPFSRLVYPVPKTHGLGIHATVDLSGQTRFGPDVCWVSSVDYDFDETRKADFIASIRRYYPGLDPAKLHPSYTGIRSKLSPEGAPARDFAILGPRDHGVPGLVHLLGIESPGLTSALAIAECVEGLLSET